ncbi:MAG TPA: cellulase family glycosylhydrolase [Verrucomicrobiae bacterium]|nr:cellulase family glycosylhydrolase [Verrucomicrobiae bacterium]
MCVKSFGWIVGISLFANAVSFAQTNTPPAPPLERIRVSDDKRHFVFAGSGKRFTPWGFNYDHDRSNRLLETYWIKEWKTVEEDFAEMKQLGANVVRIHLQVSRFMKSAQETDAQSLAQLGRLLLLAEKTGLYLDVTGLGCYDKQDVPPWYDRLDEAERWDVQARFWEGVAATCRNSPAVFCYDLMNEPVLTEDKKSRDWTPGAFGDRYFVQRLTLDFQGRTRESIGDAWVSKMVAAVRAHDQQHLITLGAIPWALTWPNAKPGIEANTNLDFLSLHFYPKQGEVGKALKALAVYDVGRPILIEEMFPLSCSVSELDQFVAGSRPLAAGWIGFYWGKTIAEYKQKTESIAEGMTLDWLEYFAKKSPAMQ